MSSLTAAPQRSVQQPSIASVRPAAPHQPRRDNRVRALERFALSITVFNILGHTVLGFEQSAATPLVVALWAYILDLSLEFIDARLHGRRPAFAGSGRALFEFLLPTQISAMAVSMLLFAGPRLWPYLLGITIALCSKHLVKAPVNGRWRHTLNPSNLGIAVVLLLFPWVGIAPPYQFTAKVSEPFTWLIPIGITILGSMLNISLTKKGPLISAWLIGFVTQATIRIIFFHATLSTFDPFTGTAFLLFTFYMITDPGTTPFDRRGQIMFGAGTALLYGILVTMGVSFTLFFALVLACAIRTASLWIKEVQRRVR